MVKIPKGDITFLASQAENILDTCEDAEQECHRFLENWPSGTQHPWSKDVYVLLSTVTAIMDSYLRAKGLKRHPASKTEKEHFAAGTRILGQIFQEVIDRPYLYPRFKSHVDKGIVGLELLEILSKKGQEE